MFFRRYVLLHVSAADKKRKDMGRRSAIEIAQDLGIAVGDTALPSNRHSNSHVIAVMDLGCTAMIGRVERTRNNKWQRLAFVSTELLEPHMTEITALHRMKYSVPIDRGHTFVHTVAIPIDSLPDTIDTDRMRRESALERRRMSNWIKTHNIGGMHAPTRTFGDKLKPGKKKK